MPLRPRLLTDLGSRLHSIASLNLTSASSASDIFEAYTFSLVVSAAKRERGNIRFEDIDEKPASHLIFRTSPGRIFKPSPPASPILYTHAVVEFPGKPELEVHQGIYVSGKSGLLHECDVAVLSRAEAQTCRSEKVSPRSARVILAAECKFYSSGLGISLARGFLGLTSDLWSDGRFFVSNTSSDSVKKLLTHHKRAWQHNVTPTQHIVVNRLTALFEKVFEEYKAKY